MILQMKVVEDRSDNTVNFVKSGKEPLRRVDSGKPIYRECWNCGYQHEHKKELCPAFGKTCNKCNKRNRFAAKCRSKQKAGAIQVLDEDGEELSKQDWVARALMIPRLSQLSWKVGQLSCHGTPKRWTASFMFGPTGSQQSDTA